MITNFENITHELSPDELELIPVLIKGFSRRKKDNPITAPEIVRLTNVFIRDNGLRGSMTEPRLRKCCNYIRSNGMLPLIATSSGYYVSYDAKEIESQIQSLRERAASIRRCADGMMKWIQPVHSGELDLFRNNNIV